MYWNSVFCASAAIVRTRVASAPNRRHAESNPTHGMGRMYPRRPNVMSIVENREMIAGGRGHGTAASRTAKGTHRMGGANGCSFGRRSTRTHHARSCCRCRSIRARRTRTATSCTACTRSCSGSPRMGSCTERTDNTKNRTELRVSKFVGPKLTAPVCLSCDTTRDFQRSPRQTALGVVFQRPARARRRAGRQKRSLQWRPHA